MPGAEACRLQPDPVLVGGGSAETTDDVQPPAIPDVLIVGSSYCGLRAAGCRWRLVRRRCARQMLRELATALYAWLQVDLGNFGLVEQRGVRCRPDYTHD